MNMRIKSIGLACAGVLLAGWQAGAQQSPPPEARNLVVVHHTDLQGRGDGGESMQIQQLPDGRRFLYFVHQASENCLSVLDVTRPEQPELVAYLPSPDPGATQCNGLGLSGNVLAISNWTSRAETQGHKGMWLLDVSDIERLKSAKSLQDLAFSFFDTSGPYSRGSHWLWFVDGEFVHMTTGTADSDPTARGHDQFYVIVDVRDREHPREVARWWVPGTMKGDACLPECLPHDGHPSRAHNIQVYPDRPDRAYVGYFGAGWMILDISGLADVRAGRAKTFTPKLVSHVTTGPAFPVNSHTLQPIPGTNLAWAADEAVNVRNEAEKCIASPKMLWLMDITAETNPLMVGYAPLAENAAELCQRQGRYGPYNLHMNIPTPTSRTLKNTMVVSYFGGGIRIFRLVDVPGVGNVPPQIVEIGHLIPEAPPRNPTHTSEMGAVLVADDGLIYSNDRRTGGLYILRYTGKEPLD